MKITHIQSQIVRLPAEEPLADGPASPGVTRDFVALTIGTDQGIEGIGVTPALAAPCWGRSRRRSMRWGR